MAFLGAVCTAGDNSLPLYALLHVPWWVWHPMACLSPLSLPTFASPVHAWDWKLLHGDWCCQFIFAHECCWMTWVLNKPQLVLHFVCICTGWEWGGEGRFDVIFLFDCFFFLIWSKEAETCLEVFQLPAFLFDITCPSILCQPSKETGSFACVSLKQPAAWTIKIMENTQVVLSKKVVVGNTNSSCVFLPL